MNLLIRIALLIAAVTAICYWPNGLTMLALFFTPIAMVLIENAPNKPPRAKRNH